MATKENPVLVLVIGTATEAERATLATRYNAAVTLTDWDEAAILAPEAAGKVVLIVLPEPPQANMIASNCVLLAGNRGVMLRELALADALAGIG